MAVPTTSAAASRWPTVSTPSHAARGTPASASSETASQASITGRRGRRSTHAPAGRPTTTQGAHVAATSSATTNVPARSVVIATRGRATPVSVLPKPLTVSPIHSRRKSLCRSRPPRGRRPAA